MYAEIIVIGIVIALIYGYFTGLSPAGLIVPGYIVLALSSPIKLLWTLVTVLITLGIYKLISRFTVLYGQRRFAIMVIIALLVGRLLTLLPIPLASISVIGYLVPGIIAKEYDRQGFVRTTYSLAIVSALTLGVAMLFGYRPF